MLYNRTKNYYKIEILIAVPKTRIYEIFVMICHFLILFRQILRVSSKKSNTLEVMNFVPNAHILEALFVEPIEK